MEADGVYGEGGVPEFFADYTQQRRGARIANLLIDIPFVFEPTRHVMSVRIMMRPMDRPAL
jgi:hypothetical protein